MAQSDEPITDEVVAAEILTALEAMAQDGGSELGVFKVRLARQNPRRLILTVGKGRFSFTVHPLKIAAATCTLCNTSRSTVHPLKK